MNGECIKTKILEKIILQENGIMRNTNGHIIARLVDDIDFDSEHIIDRGENLDKSESIAKIQKIEKLKK